MTCTSASSDQLLILCDTHDVIPSVPVKWYTIDEGIFHANGLFSIGIFADRMRTLGQSDLQFVLSNFGSRGTNLSRHVYSPSGRVTCHAGNIKEIHMPYKRICCVAILCESPLPLIAVLLNMTSDCK